MKKYQIYCIQNKINNKKYIGYSSNYIKRTEGHLRAKSKVILLKQAVEKYGRDMFSVEMLYDTDSLNEIKEKEKILIIEHDSFTPNGYNIAAGGTGGDTFTYNPRREEIKANRIKSVKKHYELNESPLKGIKKPPRSKEYCENISIAKRGDKNPMFGKKTKCRINTKEK